MARDFMAQMLDELMGRNRNARPDERKELRWDDPSICKHFLAYYCPNELFTNTKADLGVCKLMHDDDLKAQYQADSRKGKMGYEDGFLRFLKSMIQDVDRRIERGKGRLEATRQVTATNTGTKYDDKVKDLTQKIDELLQEAEKLGSMGRVEEAQSKLRQSDQLRKDRDGLKATLELAVQQEKQLEVCQTCGAFLIVGDAQQRIDDHLSGKQHVGYAQIRKTVEEEEEKMRKELEERRKERERSRGESRSGRDVERRDRNGHTRSRTRSRERSKHSERGEGSRRRRSSSRSDDRSKRKRSRSGSKKKDRERSRDRERSSKNRSRSRDRSHRSSKSDRRDRSRERDDKRRRSKSPDEKRHRSRSKDSKRRERKRSRSSDGSGKSSNSQNTTESIPIPGESQQETQDVQVPSLDAIDLPEGNMPSQHHDKVMASDE